MSTPNVATKPDTVTTQGRRILYMSANRNRIIRLHRAADDCGLFSWWNEVERRADCWQVEMFCTREELQAVCEAAGAPWIEPVEVGAAPDLVHVATSRTGGPHGGGALHV